MSIFFAGAIIGSFFAASMDIGDGILNSYINIGEPTAASLRKIILLDVALMLLIFISAFLKAGMFLPPVAICIKGFFLSLLITTFIKVLGAKGYFTAFFAAFFSGFLALSCMILLGLQAMEISSVRRRFRGRRRPFKIDRAYYITACICFITAVLSGILHSYIAPFLCRAAIALILPS